MVHRGCGTSQHLGWFTGAARRLYTWDGSQGLRDVSTPGMVHSGCETSSTGSHNIENNTHELSKFALLQNCHSSVHSKRAPQKLNSSIDDHRAEANTSTLVINSSPCLHLQLSTMLPEPVLDSDWLLMQNYLHNSETSVHVTQLLKQKEIISFYL